MTENAPPTPPPSQPPDPSSGAAYTGPAPDQDSKTMGMLCHLLGIFTAFLGPLIIWLMKKDTSPFVDDQGKEALNWHLTMIIGWVAGGFAYLFCIGPLIHLAIFVIVIVFGIMGSMKANEGIAYRYPFAIRIVK